MTYRYIDRVVSKDGNTVRRYGTPQFLLRSTERWYGMLLRYAFFVMGRVGYVSTVFEFKIPDFSRIAPAFCIQRQKTAEADAKCIN